MRVLHDAIQITKQYTGLSELEQKVMARALLALSTYREEVSRPIKSLSQRGLKAYTEFKMLVKIIHSDMGRGRTEALIEEELSLMMKKD